MGLTMTQWDELSEYDRAWVLAVQVADATLKAEQEAQRCPVCGGPKSECQDMDNQHAFEAAIGRCLRARAVAEAQRKRTDHDGVFVMARLNPDKKKSVMKKG